VLVVVGERRQRDLRLARLAVAQDQQPLGRDTLGQHLAAQRGGGQRREPRVQRGEDGFAWGGHEMEPLPLMFTNGPLYMAIAAVIGVIHGLVFFWIEPALPRGIFSRGASFAVILWALMALYFEFHTPFNMFGEPAVLVAVELAFWIAVTLVQGVVLSVIYGRGRRELASPVE
jgi:hypothetical protein